MSYLVTLSNHSGCLLALKTTVLNMGKKEGLWHSYVVIWSSTPYLGLKVDALHYTLVIANMLPRELLLVELLVILMQVKLCFCCDFKNKNMHKLNQCQQF